MEDNESSRFAKFQKALEDGNVKDKEKAEFRASCVEQHLKKLKEFLSKMDCFTEQHLNNPDYWRAKRRKDASGNRDAKYCFEYVFNCAPAEFKTIPAKKIPSDVRLDYQSYAFRAYCAGQELLRKKTDDDIFLAFTALYGKWCEQQKIVSTLDSAKATHAGSKQPTEIDRDTVKNYLKAGKTPTWIAKEMKCSRTTIYKIKNNM